MADVKLYHFISGYATCIADAGYNLHGLSGDCGFGGAYRSVISKSRVAESVSERIERSSFEIAVSAAFHRIGVEIGQLFVVCIERDRKSSRRVAVAP